MKFFLRNLFMLVLAMFFSTAIFSQKAPAHKPKVIRCGTMQYYAEQMRLDPLLAAKAREIADQKRSAILNRQGNQNRPQQIQAIIVIPIVFHIVGSASNQAFASDASIQRQVDVLNRDFAGLNPDSAKLPPAFRAVFGHSNIRFVLAKRTPLATHTNGIERRVTSQTFTSDTYNSILKHTTAGGLDQWDGDKYFNVWVANFTDDLLGVATFPNVSAPLDNEQGVAIHYGSLDQPCSGPFTGDFDGGRTLVHETGHYFYLFHIWGDDGGACTGSDFETPFGSLPGICSDDTPNQADATSGCLSGVHTDQCSPGSPGFMYQNYMDYTHDPCYGMFTMGQVCRAEAALDLYRSSLKTSYGSIPVVGFGINNDVRISEILNPDSRGFSCGASTSICTAPFNPQVLIVNDGDAPVTSLTFDVRIDGVSITTQSWNGNLQPADFAYVTIADLNAMPGKHILTIKTINPNGLPDGRLATDSSTATFTVLSAGITATVITESFEAPTFPPPGWRVDNENTSSLTWRRTATAGNPGNASATLSAFNYPESDEIDYLISPKIQTTGYDSLAVTFNVAYAKYSNAPEDWETLEVVYSEDCGLTWKPTGYLKTGNALATNGGSLITSSFTPTTAEWRTETVMIGLCGISSDVSIGFKSINNYGNNLYLDNINFGKFILPDPNVEVLTVIDPNGLYCNGNIQPKLKIFNRGTNTLTTATFNYSIDGGPDLLFNWTGNLAKCSAPLTINLPALNVPAGNHLFTVFTTKPNGVDDPVPSNDTARASFSVIAIVNGPVSEGFEETSFPPANWAVQNLDNSTTWARTTTASRTGAASMMIENFNYPFANTLDKFISPRVVLGIVDSAFVSFDYSYNQGAQFPGNSGLPVDTLEVAVTTNCGITTTSVWKKWGAGLQTQSDLNFPTSIAYTPTLSTQWRNERINITRLIQGVPDFQVYFIARSNKQNNLYIDNINIVGKVLPQRLKNQGYLIYPSPFSSSFRIHHLVPPVDLRSAQVYNSAGQLVWYKRLGGNTPTEVNVDLANLAKGVYILKMIYFDKIVVERIVKS